VSEERLARLGGDEFTVLLEDIRDCGDAIRVRSASGTFEHSFRGGRTRVGDDRKYRDRFCATSYAKSEELVRDAEIAMYRASGRKSTLSGLR